MEILQPDTWDEALALKAEHPGARPIAGGTDLMVELNFDRARPPQVLDLTRVGELSGWAPENGRLRIGSGVSYTRLIAELGDRLPGLAIASRTVGSPQIRNRGTAGDAVVEVASVRGTRRVPVAEFVTGPKRHAMADDELISAFHIAPADAPQQFSKIGTRNAMVIAVASLSLHLWAGERAVKACIGSAGPTPIRATEAETFIAGVLASEGLWESRAALPAAAVAEFGALVGAAARPIDDVRGTAAYRHHVLGVLGRRTLQWAWTQYREEAA